MIDDPTHPPHPDLAKAISFATKAHANQRDKAGYPYILHPLRVMAAMDTDAEKITAVLHDVMEDCGVSRSTIEEMFGKEIADAVVSVTRIEKPTKERYFDFVLRSKANPIGRKVKIADVKDNLSEERLSVLSEEEQKGMRKRYEKALAILES